MFIGTIRNTNSVETTIFAELGRIAFRCGVLAKTRSLPHEDRRFLALT